MTRVRMLVAYDGTDFHGFATNPAVRTVAGELSDAIARVVRHPVLLLGAGRTDAGVHAWGQVVAFDTASEVDPPRLQRALVGQLAPEIVVREVAVVDLAFDPRREARSRSYRYTVLNRSVPDPFLDRYSWWVREPLDVAAMNDAAPHLVGEHDFASFCRRGAEGSTTERTVLAAGWAERGEGVLEFDITGRAFCWQMVRSIAGTLVDVGRGRFRAADVARVLAARDRGAAGTVAPPRGLCLREVTY